MPEEDAGVAEAEGVGGFDEFLFGEGGGGGFDNTSHGEPAEGGDGDGEGDEGGITEDEVAGPTPVIDEEFRGGIDGAADDFAEEDDDDEEGHGEEAIDDAHHGVPKPAADVASNAAVNDPEGGGEGGGEEGYEEGNLAAFKDTHEEVAAELISAKNTLFADAGEAVGEVLFISVEADK